jgi:hypothetical protein
MKKIILSIILLLMATSIYATAGYFSSLPNVPYSLNMTPISNFSVSLDFPFFYITNLTLSIKNVTGNPGICEQERFSDEYYCSASNSSTAGMKQQGWTSSLIHDSNWATSSACSSNGSYKANYTLPKNVVDAMWQVKDEWSIYNMSVNASCLSTTKPVLQLNFTAELTKGVAYSCYNDTHWVTMYTNDTPGNNEFYEESIFWNLTLDPYNLTIYYNNTEIWKNLDFLNKSTNASIPLDITNTILANNCSDGEIIGSDCRINMTLYSVTSSGIEMKTLNNSYEYGLDNCTLYGNRTLNFTIQEETNLTALEVSVNGVFTYTHNRQNYTNLTITDTDTNNFSICIHPRWATIYADAYLQYESTEGFKERYFLVNVTLTNNTRQVNMYNFNIQTGISELTAIVVNNIYTPRANVIMKMQRYYPAQSSWLTVQIDRSDEFGKGIFYVIQNEEDYRFIFEENNTRLDSTESVKFSCASATECEQTFPLYGAGAATTFPGMGGNITYNNQTTLVIFTWNDPSNTAASVRLLVEKQASDGVITICNLRATSAAGSLNCNVSAYDGIITARAYRSSSPYVPWVSVIVEKLATQLYDVINIQEGMFFSALIQMTLIAFGIATGSALATVVFSGVGIIFIFLFGLNTVITLAFSIGVFCLCALVAFMVKN